MNVKDLKEQLASMPEDAEVMMYINKMFPVFVVQSGTVENLEPTGETMFGMEVVGGKKNPIVILATTVTDSTKSNAVNEILSGVSALNMLRDGNDYSIDNVKHWVSHSQEHFDAAVKALCK